MPKKTFELAHEAGATLIAQLKGNQPSLLNAVQALCQGAAPTDHFESKEQHRGRQEIRTVDIFPLAENALDPEWQGLLTTVIRVQRERMDRSSRSGLWKSRNDEVAFYLSSAPVTAIVAAIAIRGHWGIENRAHYVRDVSMAEDASRIRKNPGILARIRTFATNILRANGARNIRDTRYRLAIGGLDAILSCRAG